MDAITKERHGQSTKTGPRKDKNFSFSHHPYERSNKLAGKVILITGGTSGLGAESAVALARHGPSRIYITGCGQQQQNSETGAEDVIKRVRQEYQDSKQHHHANDCLKKEKSNRETEGISIPKETEIIFLQMDLSSLSSVSAAAGKILSGEHSSPRLDIILCNAGIAAVPYSTTGTVSDRSQDEKGREIGQEDGYEIQFATNYLGHALLIRKLLPLLRKSNDGGRIISVASFAFRLAGMVPGFGLFEMFDGLRAPDTTARLSSNKWIGYDALGLGMITRWLRYAESKLAMVLYTRQLAARCPDVTTVCVTPGFVNTGMVKEMRFCDRLGTRLLAGLTWALGIQGEGKGMVDPAEGAENQIWACLADKEELQNGGLYDPVGLLCEEDRLSKPARDHELGEKLWMWTEATVRRWL